MGKRSLFRLLPLAVLLLIIISTAASAGTVAVRFYNSSGFVLVDRPVPSGMSPTEAAVRSLVAGPTQEELSVGTFSSIPIGTSINSLTITDTSLVVDMSSDVVKGLNEDSLTRIFDQFRATLGDFPAVTSIKLTSGGKLLASYLPAVAPVPSKAPAQIKAAAAVSSTGLSGRKICIGPSHGKFWNGSGWYWQRGLTCGLGEDILEDTNSIRLVQFLKQYLTQDGATFYAPRQLDETDCCNSDTGLPWWKMCASTWLHHAGYPASVWAAYSGDSGADMNVNRNSDDIRARPLFADYMGADIYIACHTNAGGDGTATGTETYHDSQMEHPEYESASTDLANAVHNSVIDGIRTTFESEPAWTSRGVKDSAAAFGEIRVPSRPAILIELAFHDDCTRDALYLTDDFFRSIAEWSIYRGVCSYFGTTPTWDKYSCEYVSDTIPTTMVPGQVYNCSITFRNRGVCWFTSHGFRLGKVITDDPFATTFTRVDISGSVRPGSTYTFNFQLTGPAAGGTHTTTWQMVRDGYTWFGPTVSKTIDAGPVLDVTGPSAPTNLRATATTASSVALAWNASTDDFGVVGYRIFRNGTQVGTSTGTTYTDSGLSQNTTYNYQVDAYDAIPNYGAMSASLPVTTLISATWGPYNLTQNQTIYSPGNYSSTLRTGWYTTTAGYGAARIVAKAADANMTTMPAQARVTGATFTIAYGSGTYSTSANNPTNIYRITKTWTAGSGTLWNAPWATAGGDYASVGTTAQDTINPASGTVYTFSVAGTNGWFPYGVLIKGNNESSITYRKGWLGSSPYPTLAVTYTPPTPTIRSWAYLGHYAQGATGDHTTRINTDHVSGTYGGISITEANVAPGASDGTAGPSYGNSYGAYKWISATSTNDVVNLLSAPFYNVSAKDNGTTYAGVYVYNSGAAKSVYMGIGSDDDVKVYLNGTMVGSFINTTGRGCYADTDFYGPMTLSAGWNRLLVKVENGGGGYGLYARFSNADRTAVSGLTTYTSDATAPTAPTTCTEASGTQNGVWQRTVSSPSFTWSGATDPQGTSEGVSGIRGYKVYFGTDAAGVPSAFQTATTYAPGAVADGTYYLRVSTVDYALNESEAATLFTFRKDSLVTSAKSSADGTALTLASQVVTATTGNGFYVEQSDRTSGIKVVWSDTPVAVGDVVRVAGIMGTDTNFERLITASSITPDGTGSIEPLLMTNKSIGGADWSYNSTTGAGQRGVIDGVGLNNIGLLVRTSGAVAAVGSDYIIINDGSNARGGSVVNGIKVLCGGLTKPTVGQMVVVTGISTIDNVRGNLYRALLITNQDNIGNP